VINKTMPARVGTLGLAAIAIAIALATQVRHGVRHCTAAQPAHANSSYDAMALCFMLSGLLFAYDVVAKAGSIGADVWHNFGAWASFDVGFVSLVAGMLASIFLGIAGKKAAGLRCANLQRLDEQAAAARRSILQRLHEQAAAGGAHIGAAEYQPPEPALGVTIDQDVAGIEDEAGEEKEEEDEKGKQVNLSDEVMLSDVGGSEEKVKVKGEADPPPPVVMTPTAAIKLALAKHTFRGDKTKGQLPFKKGTAVEVLGPTDGDWWTGRKCTAEGGSPIGMFPASYVELGRAEVGVDRGSGAQPGAQPLLVQVAPSPSYTQQRSSSSIN
jgi:hypothetical protein